MRTPLCSAFPLAGLAAVTLSLAAQEPIPSPRCELGPGPLPVGFNRMATVDSTRRLADGAPRPMSISLWYPARAGAGPRLRYRDYLLGEPAPIGAPPIDEVAALVGFLTRQGAADSTINTWLDRPMLAYPAPAPSGGRFPLVLIAQGNGQSAPDQAPLAEWLASHGYVVATLPSPSRIGGPLTGEEEVGRRAEEQAEDLGFLRGVLARRADVDGSRVALVGHSFGARGALLLGMRDSSLRALVSLDGGIGTATARTSFEAAPSFRPTLQVPLLHFYEALDRFMTPDFRLLQSLTGADRWLVGTVAMHHHHFTNLGTASCTEPGLRPFLQASDTTGVSYNAVARLTLSFLDAWLKPSGTPWNPPTDWPGLGPVSHLAPGRN